MTDTQIVPDGIEHSLSATPMNPIECEHSRRENTCMAKAFQRNSHIKMLSLLTPEVRKRLRALRKLQLQTNAVEMEFSEKEFELEKEYHVKHQEILKKRFEIISGKYEPGDEECDYPDPDLLQRIDENISMFTQLNVSGTAEGCDDSSPIKGIPNFWTHILYSNPMLDFIIHDGDEDILKHLIDIRVVYQSDPHFAFILEFEFSANPFFENTTLTKEYLLKMKFDDLLLYEGPEICKTIGCEIKWKSEKKLEQPTFLNFFNPPILPDDVMDPSYDEIKAVLENDFEIGNYIKDHIIPKATLYYTGEFRDGCDMGCESDSAEEEETEDEKNQIKK